MKGRDDVRLGLLSAPRRPVVTKHAHRTSGVPLRVNCSCATRSSCVDRFSPLEECVAVCRFGIGYSQVAVSRAARRAIGVALPEGEVTSCSQCVPGLFPVGCHAKPWERGLFPVFPVGASHAIFNCESLSITQQPGTLGTPGTMHGMSNLRAEHAGNRTWNNGGRP